jgi:hypothetical protein
MPFDHYVSQVHLKNFNSPALDGELFAIRKSDLKRFQPRSRDICRIEDGSTNPYLTESQAIEDFLNARLCRLADFAATLAPYAATPAEFVATR